MLSETASNGTFYGFQIMWLMIMGSSSQPTDQPVSSCTDYLWTLCCCCCNWICVLWRSAQRCDRRGCYWGYCVRGADTGRHVLRLQCEGCKTRTNQHLQTRNQEYRCGKFYSFRLDHLTSRSSQHDQTMFWKFNLNKRKVLSIFYNLLTAGIH